MTTLIRCYQQADEDTLLRVCTAKATRQQELHNWGGWTRTTNFLINSQAVCQLTYTPKPNFLAATDEPFARVSGLFRTTHSGRSRRS